MTLKLLLLLECAKNRNGKTQWKPEIKTNEQKSKVHKLVCHSRTGACGCRGSWEVFG